MIVDNSSVPSIYIGKFPYKVMTFLVTKVVDWKLRLLCFDGYLHLYTSDNNNESPGTLSPWAWAFLPWQLAPVSRQLLVRWGLFVVVKGEGLGWLTPPPSESRLLIDRPSCLSPPLCTPVALPVKKKQSVSCYLFTLTCVFVTVGPLLCLHM